MNYPPLYPVRLIRCDSCGLVLSRTSRDALEPPESCPLCRAAGEWQRLEVSTFAVPGDAGRAVLELRASELLEREPLEPVEPLWIGPFPRPIDGTGERGPPGPGPAGRS